MYCLPQVSQPKSICELPVIHTCYMLRPTLSSLFDKYLSSANLEASHRSNSTCPPLRHFSQAQTLKYFLELFYILFYI